MHTHTLLLFSFFFFLCATQHLVSSKSFLSSNKNRRILNEPSLLPSQPPNQPPLSPPILPSTSSTPNLKHPFSTTTTTTNPSPFFPFYPYPSPPPPPPPPPPSFSTFAYFPANISSLVLPQSPKTKSSSHKPLSIAITAVACVTAIAAVSTFIYCRRNNASAGNKTSSSETSIDVFPPNSETANGTRKERHASSTSSECLYLGTVIHSRGIEDAPDIRKVDSPELQPIPRLAPRLLQHSQPPQARVVASSTQASEEHEEFYSPRGSSLGSDENGLDELSSNSDSSPSENNDNKIFHEPNGALRISNASRNEDALSRRLSSASNGSRKSISPSCSAFSLPSSPEKAMHFGNLDQSPRMSSFSDRFKQPGLSSLSLSPTLLSSPETEWRNKTSNESSKFPNFVPHRNINDVLDQIATHPPIGPFNRVSPPPPPQPPPPPPPLQPQKKHWEVPTSMPPELIPPSRPFVLQNQTTKVSPVVELMQSSQSFRENEKNMKPKLKPLHWDKVRARSGREMVWDHLKSSSFKLNEEMIETLFVVKPKVNTQHSVLPQPSQEERILDPKKSQNIAILVRALNVTVEEVCEALLEGNADTLGTELLESLLKMAPSEEEERKLKEYKDDSPTKLGPAEKFLKAVLHVPFAFKRVEAMHYVVNFESEVEYLRKSFQILEAASEELRNCRMFSKLLEAVLKTGNRMNVGTIRGEAQAFKLDTLLKLADVKGADGKTTLLHFVVQEIIRTEGARLSGTNQTPISTLNEDAKCRRLGLQVVSSLSSELANVKKAAAMDSEILSSDVSKLTKGIACIAEVAKTNEMEGSDESCQKFTESMNKFIRMAEEEIPKIEAQERVALTLVKGITEYFHGNLAKEEAHPFRIFMVVRDFLTVLDRVCREVGMINERTMVSSAHKFPVPVNPMLPQTLPGLTGRQQYQSSDDSASSP